jgi:O-antigen ligase
MMPMKKWLDISGNTGFILVLLVLVAIQFSMAVLSIAAMLLGLLWVVNLFVNRSWPELPGFYIMFLVFAGFTLLGTCFSNNPLVSLQDNRELLIFLIFPIMLLILNTRKRIRWSLYTVLGAAVLQSVYGIAWILVHGISLDHRLQGFTSHWMTFAGLLTGVFIFFMVWALRNRWQTALVLALPLGLILLAILLSLTRSAWMGIAVACALYGIYSHPRITLVMVPIMVAIFIFLPPPIQKRFVSIVDTSNATNRDRVYMAYSGWKMFQDHPWFGVGANNVGSLYPAYRHPEARQNNPHLHNNFIQVLAERGILAFLAYTAAFFMLLWNLIKKVGTTRGEMKSMTLAVLFVVIGFLVSGLFEYNFGDSEIKYMLLYFMSLPFVSAWGREDDSRQDT